MAPADWKVDAIFSAIFRDRPLSEHRRAVVRGVQLQQTFSGTVPIRRTFATAARRETKP